MDKVLATRSIIDLKRSNQLNPAAFQAAIDEKFAQAQVISALEAELESCKDHFDPIIPESSLTRTNDFFTTGSRDLVAASKFKGNVLANIIRLVNTPHSVKSAIADEIQSLFFTGCSEAILGMRLILGRTIEQVVFELRSANKNLVYYIKRFKLISLDSIQSEISKKVVECVDAYISKHTNTMYNDIWAVPKSQLEIMMVAVHNQVNSALEFLADIPNIEETRHTIGQRMDDIRKQIHRDFLNKLPVATKRKAIISEAEQFISAQHTAAMKAINDGGKKIFYELYAINYDVVKGYDPFDT